MDNETKQLAEDLLSNRSDAALAREYERIVIKQALPPLNLREAVGPLEQYLTRELVICPTVRGYLATRRPVYPMLDGEADALAAAMELYYGVDAPYYIDVSITLQLTGRAWVHEEDAALFLTGFVLQKEE